MNSPEIPDSTASLLDELLQHDPAAILQKAAHDAQEWRITCAKLLRTEAGKRWMRLAMVKYNLTGSVFDTSWSATAAAFRDGQRSILSELLNATAATNYNETDD